jgi:hypothetical protein
VVSGERIITTIPENVENHVRKEWPPLVVTR